MIQSDFGGYYYCNQRLQSDIKYYRTVTGKFLTAWQRNDIKEVIKFLLLVSLSRVIFHLFYINNLLLLRKVLYYPNRILGHFDKFMGLIDVVHLSMCCFADCFHHFLKQNNTSLFIVLNLHSTLALRIHTGSELQTGTAYTRIFLFSRSSAASFSQTSFCK